MSRDRKLQAEIGRTLKKVDEGVSVFDELYEKVYDAETQSQKLKYEGDLKKEIKKLQRHRDSIKTWAANSDIKDKSKLLAARRLIESKMEAFKICEKETKTKAYSKEGLARARELDPEEKKRKETRDWLTEQLEAIQQMIEETEAELEAASAEAASRGKRKKKKKQPVQLSEEEEELNDLIEQHQYHASKIEIIVRMLDNKSLTPERVEEIKDDIEYYVSDCNEPEFYNDPDIYEVLEIDTKPPSKSSSGKSSKGSSDGASSGKSPHKKAVAKKVVMPTLTIGRGVSKKQAAAALSKIKEAESKKAANDAKKAEEAKRLAAKKEEERKRQQEAAVARQKQVQQQAQQAKLQAQQAKLAQQQKLQAEQQAKLRQQQQQQRQQQHQQQQQQQRQQQQQQQQKQQQQQQNQQQWNGNNNNSGSSSSGGVGGGNNNNNANVAGMSTKVGGGFEGGLGGNAGLGGVLPDGKLNASGTGGIGARPGQNRSITHHLLDAALWKLPMPSDSHRSAHLRYQSRNPFNTPPVFPQEPATVIQRADLYSKLDVDTLFFIFYFQQGSYQQYLAAAQLKKASWRYHKKYKTWFQRHEEPTETTEEYERGTYVYFDFESGWCQRIKTEFTFEYSFLEDDLKAISASAAGVTA